MKDSRQNPLGIVSRGTDSRGEVGLRSLGAIYAAIGAGDERISEWHDRYGYDSLGVGDNGDILAPGFPVFSKVVDMVIDPVDLSELESRSLIAECERAMMRTNDPGARKELTEIRALAMTALEHGDFVRFGHP